MDYLDLSEKRLPFEAKIPPRYSWQEWNYKRRGEVTSHRKSHRPKVRNHTAANHTICIHFTLQTSFLAVTVSANMSIKKLWCVRLWCTTQFYNPRYCEFHPIKKFSTEICSVMIGNYEKHHRRGQPRGKDFSLMWAKGLVVEKIVCWNLNVVTR